MVTFSGTRPASCNDSLKVCDSGVHHYRYYVRHCPLSEGHVLRVRSTPVFGCLVAIIVTDLLLLFI
jgi:hypothetical protein